MEYEPPPGIYLNVNRHQVDRQRVIDSIWYLSIKCIATPDKHLIVIY